MADSFPSFFETLKQHGLVLKRKPAEILQINLGRLCNQVCRHCHLSAGPHKRDIMNRNTMDEVIDFAQRCKFKAVDITGGAPEMNPDLPYLIETISSVADQVMLRSNLSALLDYSHDQLIPVLKKNRVILVSSFPSLNPAQTDSQRGIGVFEKSIEALMLLNRQGYGMDGTGFLLNLVSNPSGAFLPSSQKALEKRYREILKKKWGINFNNAYTFANVPLGRFEAWLQQSGNYDDYLTLLYKSFNPCTLPGLMCRNQISVSFDGYLFDCDFNLAAGVYKAFEKTHISQIRVSSFDKDPIAVGNHCYTCTAGTGFT
ncbi:MAG: radical SAM protein [Desulfobacula sp. GWF2_41_7]|nr:MAG: radical SAM protein [Desulfobacula sp. GWF2_41_7]